jgi:hypothetical protein
MRCTYILTLFFLSLFLQPAYGQDKGTGPKEKSFKQELKTNKQLRREAREKRKLERAERKAVKKHHNRIQTKKVRKRMKESRKSATRHNENKREFFLKRWFKKKNRVGKKG